MSQTVFIIGAGASKEVGLPLGTELLDKIGKDLNFRFKPRTPELTQGNTDIFNAIRAASHDPNAPSTDINVYINAARSIAENVSLSISIDNFIDIHPNNPLIAFCGKLSIAQSILHAEENSALKVDQLRPNEISSLKHSANTWYAELFKLLTENCSAEGLKKRLSSVSFIVFNYDRCLEHYLYHAFQSVYRISSDEAAGLVNGMHIYHPYGTVGALPWSGANRPVPYGYKPSAQDILFIAAQIKTFTEGTDTEKSDIRAIRALLENSQRVVFLGFAFHRINVDLLFPERPTPMSDTKRSVFATAKGLSNSDVEHIKAELMDGRHCNSVQVRVSNDLTAYQLFHEFRRSLSFV